MILLASDLIKHGQDHSYIASCRNFEREYSEPTNAVLPSAGKSPRRVNEPANVHGKCSIYRVHDGHFGKRLHHQVSKHNHQNIFTTGLRIRESIHHATYCEPIRFISKSWDCPALTNDHETDDHGARTSSLKSTATSDEETCADSAAAEIKSACALVQILIRKADESSIKESLSEARRPGAARKEGIIQLKRLTWRSSACVSLSAFGAACFDRLRQWLHRWHRH